MAFGKKKPLIIGVSKLHKEQIEDYAAQYKTSQADVTRKILSYVLDSPLIVLDALGLPPQK